LSKKTTKGRERQWHYRQVRNIVVPIQTVVVKSKSLRELPLAKEEIKHPDAVVVRKCKNGNEV
jgi:hypothetical protein